MTRCFVLQRIQRILAEEQPWHQEDTGCGGVSEPALVWDVHTAACGIYSVCPLWCSLLCSGRLVIRLSTLRSHVLVFVWVYNYALVYCSQSSSWSMADLFGVINPDLNELKTSHLVTAVNPHIPSAGRKSVLVHGKKKKTFFEIWLWRQKQNEFRLRHDKVRSTYISRCTHCTRLLQYSVFQNEA